MNDVVDQLAVEAANTQADRSGSEAPTVLGPADDPTARYDRLLDTLAPTDPARQMLLRRYFDSLPRRRRSCSPLTGAPGVGGTGRGRPRPGGRHAELDRLIERAIDAAGVAPQVISNPKHIAGMVPLALAPGDGRGSCTGWPWRR
jgi:hypothetical protein